MKLKIVKKGEHFVKTKPLKILKELGSYNGETYHLLSDQSNLLLNVYSEPCYTKQMDVTTLLLSNVLFEHSNKGSVPKWKCAKDYNASLPRYVKSMINDMGLNLIGARSDKILFELVFANSVKLEEEGFLKVTKMQLNVTNSKDRPLKFNGMERMVIPDSIVKSLADFIIDLED